MSLVLTATLRRKSGFSLDVDLTVPTNKVAALYGPSGSGKTTLLRLIAGLEKGITNDHISISFNGETWHSPTIFMPPHKRAIGYVFQHLNLFPHINVLENLRFAEQRATTKHDYDFHQIVSLLDLAQLLDKLPHKLSGGEQQRVAIARALISQPKLLIMDEPLGSLDADARYRILPYLQRLQASFNLPIIYVSHSLDEVLYLADTVYLLNNGRVAPPMSVIEFSSNPQVNVSQPDAASIIKCEVIGHDANYALTEVDFEGQRLFIAASKYQIGDNISIRIPARDVSLSLVETTASSIINIFAGVLNEVFDPGTGATAMIRVQRGNQYLLARITRKSLALLALKPGQKIFTQIKGVALMTDYER